MDDQVQRELRGVHGQIAVATERLGLLLARHPPATAGSGTDQDPGGAEPSESVDGPSHGEAADRIAYVEATRDFMYRTLYAIDFTLLHGRIDRPMLRDARAALLQGIDAANACLMLEGALCWDAAEEDEGED